MLLFFGGDLETLGLENLELARLKCKIIFEYSLKVLYQFVIGNLISFEPEFSFKFTLLGS